MHPPLHRRRSSGTTSWIPTTVQPAIGDFEGASYDSMTTFFSDQSARRDLHSTIPRRVQSSGWPRNKDAEICFSLQSQIFPNPSIKLGSLKHIVILILI